MIKIVLTPTIKDILESWKEEKERHLAEDFDSWEEMKENTEDYDDLKDLNEVRSALGEEPLTYEDFKDDYKEN